MTFLWFIFGFVPSIAEILHEDCIVGGSDLTVPYLLFLETNRSVCGASIIAPTWALTAGSCVDESLPITFRAGSGSWSSGGTLHNGYVVHIHPRYRPGSNDYNYALVFVYPEFPIGTPGYEVVAIPRFEALPGMTLTASGWGSTKFNSTSPFATLKSTEYNVTARSSCQKFYGRSMAITSRILCSKTANASVCYGDEGGPLVMGQTKEQHGIVLGSKCATFVSFANVADQHEWIYSISGV